MHTPAVKASQHLTSGTNPILLTVADLGLYLYQFVYTLTVDSFVLGGW